MPTNHGRIYAPPPTSQPPAPLESNRRSRGLVRILNSLFGLVSRQASGFFPTQSFDWIDKVEARADAITDELRTLLAHREAVPAFEEVSSRQAMLKAGRRWKTFFLHVYGNEVPEALRLCPNTAQALAEIPNMTTAMFSILKPGMEIPPHKGPYKGVLRYQLALVIPSPDPEVCGIRVDGELRGWEPGRSMVFDDTLTHEAWNRSDEVRVVLFVDFMRPLPRIFHWFNRLVMGAMQKWSHDVRQVTQRARDSARPFLPAA